jgi:TPP-dependent indolepyruvate ferredoxin oxidoreductase alpha subunit
MDAAGSAFEPCNGAVVFQVGCPAIWRDSWMQSSNAQALIDRLCAGCEVCAQICAMRTFRSD